MAARPSEKEPIHRQGAKIAKSKSPGEKLVIQFNNEFSLALRAWRLGGAIGVPWTLRMIRKRKPEASAIALRLRWDVVIFGSQWVVDIGYNLG